MLNRERVRTDVMGMLIFKKFFAKKERGKLWVGAEGNFKLDVQAKISSKQCSQVARLKTGWRV